MKDQVDITVLLDRSGSMRSISDEVINGLNKLIDTQKKVKGDCVFTLITFDDPSKYLDGYSTIIDRNPLKYVREITDYDFYPRGGTALIDSTVRAIDEKGQFLEKLPEEERPDRVWFWIITDGLENRSCTYKRVDLNNRIKHQREVYNWKVLFIGANQDSIAEANSYGISIESAYNYNATPVGTQTMFAALDASTTIWRGTENLNELQIK